MNVIDLFSGCGGLGLGFKWAGFRSVLASDIDENCEKTYSLNFKGVPFIKEDLRNISSKNIKKIVNDNVDLVIGGPPCQGFSLANKNRNKVNDDPRNELFYEFVRVVKDLQPKAFVMDERLPTESYADEVVFPFLSVTEVRLLRASYVFVVTLPSGSVIEMRRFNGS